MPNLIDLTGRRYGRWTVIAYLGSQCYHCKCDCGNERTVRGTSLAQGRSKSCGCLHREIIGDLRRVHGECGTRLYHIWQGMLQRTLNPNNKRFAKYGPRGIDPSWRAYVVFRDWAQANGYADDLTIDRIDNDKGYGPDNCRWISASDQYHHAAAKTGAAIPQA